MGQYNWIIGLVALLGTLYVIFGGKGKSGGKLPRPSLRYIPEDVRNKEISYTLPKNILVTGGSGFLGRRIVEALLKQGCNVTVFDIRKTFDDDRVKFEIGDLVKKADCERAAKGMDAVIHTASPHASCTNAKLLEDVNVTGTRNILDACATNHVPRLVFTSSASVIYSGDDQLGVDESVDYPSSFRDVYCRTKAIAEQEVLKFDGKSGVRTVALRPHGIFGPGDVQFFPVLIENARAGKSKYIIGNGENVVDFTFVDNVVHAHLLAVERLTGNSVCGGKAYFVTNDEPVKFWTFLGDVLERFGYNRPSVTLPYGFILVVAEILEFIAKLLAPIKKINLTFTPWKVKIAGTHHFYSCKRAKADLGYYALYNSQESLDIAIDACFESMVNTESLKQHSITLETLCSCRKPLTVEEVSRHASSSSCWVIIDDCVYDVTSYLADHPGGYDALFAYAGKDCSVQFHGPQHPINVNDIAPRYFIGKLVH